MYITRCALYYSNKVTLEYRLKSAVKEKNFNITVYAQQEKNNLIQCLHLACPAVFAVMDELGYKKSFHRKS